MKYTLYPNFFFFNDTATTEIYTLSLHDALPILQIRNDFRFKGTFLYFFSIYATSSDLSVIKAISTSDIKSPIFKKRKNIVLFLPSKFPTRFMYTFNVSFS